MNALTVTLRACRLLRSDQKVAGRENQNEKQRIRKRENRG